MSRKSLPILNKPLFRRILLVIIGLVLGIQFYRWNANTLAGNTLPMPFGYGTAVVMSGSMEPALSVNDLVIIKDAKHYAPGDIVVYQSGNSLIIHRIVEIEGDVVTARGDANNAADKPFRMGLIKGKMCAVIPKVGGLAKLVKSPVGILALLSVSIVLLELSWKKEKDCSEKELDAIKNEIRALRAQLESEEGG